MYDYDARIKWKNNFVAREFGTYRFVTRTFGTQSHPINLPKDITQAERVTIAEELYAAIVGQGNSI